MGIERTATGASATVSVRIQIGRKVAYALMGAGLYGLNRVSPEVSVNMVNIYIIPAIMLGLETLCLSPID